MFYTQASLSLSLKDVPFLAGAVWTTVWVTGLSLLLGTILGFFLGLVSGLRMRFVNKLPLLFIEPLRNSPLLVQLFLVYFGIPMLTKHNPSQAGAAVFTLSLNTAAFIAVVVRASIEAIPKHQWESAYALGLGRTETFLSVIAPQALRIFLPPALGIYISQLQVSSMVSFIGLIDITKAGQVLTLRTFKPFLVWTIVLLLYFVITWPVSLWARHLERRLAPQAGASNAGGALPEPEATV